MKVYIQTGENNRITDIITYPHDGYIEAEITLPLPVGVIGGAYEFTNGMIIYRPEWDENTKIKQLEEELAEMREMLLKLAANTAPTE